MLCHILRYQHLQILILVKIFRTFRKYHYHNLRICLVLVPRYLDCGVQTRPPSPRIIIPDIQTYCSLIAQRVSIRNLLSMYSAIYSHYCCYILIHCAASTQKYHPPNICSLHQLHIIFTFFKQAVNLLEVFYDQFLFKVSLLSCHDKLFAS